MASEDYETSQGYLSDLSVTLHFHHQALFAMAAVIVLVVAFCLYNSARQIHWISSSAGSSSGANAAAAEVATTTSRNKGLDEASVNSLPMLLHGSLAFSEEDGIRESECAICLGAFEENEMIKVIPTCSHAYHSECVGKWLKTHAICPLCRATLHSFHDH